MIIKFLIKSSDFGQVKKHLLLKIKDISIQKKRDGMECNLGSREKRMKKNEKKKNYEKTRQAVIDWKEALRCKRHKSILFQTRKRKENKRDRKQNKMKETERKTKWKKQKEKEGKDKEITDTLKFELVSRMLRKLFFFSFLNVKLCNRGQNIF